MNLRAFSKIMALAMISALLAGCLPAPDPATMTPALTPTPDLGPLPPGGAFESQIYRNLFAEYLGATDSEVQAKLDAAWNQLFYGNDGFQRVYYPVGEDMAYIMDIGNSDVRSEGMSYGMMIAVQLDKQPEFDRLWKWARTYMYQSDGPYRGYFAWHCSADGEKLAANPASDGEEWFVTALFFASARWGDGEGIFDYRAEAQQILDTMLHKSEEDNGLATNMFDLEARQVVFVPSGYNSTYTDPSYHLPAFYELWARWATADNGFWAEAAQASRAYFRSVADPQTGLMPDYANFDGTLSSDDYHQAFRFDAWRTLSNVAVDHAWFGADAWQVEQSERVLGFLASQGMDSYPNQFTLEGEPLSGDHSTGLVAMAAVGALAARPGIGQPFVQALWDTDIPSGTWRYYDGLLYMLGLLHASGNFRIYEPAASGR